MSVHRRPTLLKAVLVAVIVMSDTGELRAQTNLPEGAIASFGKVPFHNGSRITMVEMSPDGKLLATLGHRELNVWDTATGETRHRFFFDISDRDARVRDLTFSPDSKHLACSPSLNLVVIWDLTTGNEVRRFGHKLTNYSFNFFRFSADGSHVIALLEEGLSWLNVQTGAIDRQIPNMRIDQLSSDEKTYVVVRAANGEKKARVDIGDLSTGEVRHSLPIAALSSASESGLLFLPDGNSMAVVHHVGYSPAEIQVWDFKTGKQGRSWPVPQSDSRQMYRLSLSHDGKLLYFPDNKEKLVRRFSLETGKELNPIRVNGDWTIAVFPHPDGQRLFSVQLERIRRWDLNTMTELSKSADFIDWRAVAISRDGRWLAMEGRDDRFEGPVDLWDVEERKHTRIHAEMNNGQSLAFTPDGKSLAANRYSHIQFLRVPELTQFKKLEPGESIQEATIQFTSDGRFVSSLSSTGRLRVIDTASARDVWNLDEVSSTLWSPDGKKILSASRGERLQLTDAQTWKADFELAQPIDKTDRWGRSQVAAMTFSPDGETLAMAMSGGSICLLDASTGVERGRFQAIVTSEMEFPRWDIYPHATSLAFSPDSKWLAVGAQDGYLRIWEVSTRRELFRLHGHEESAKALAFSADGRRLVSFGGAEGFLWDLRPKAPSDKTFDPVEGLFSADGPTTYRAFWKLFDDPAAPALLRRKLPPQRVDAAPERMARLIAELDAEDYQTREAATRALAEMKGTARTGLVAATGEEFLGPEAKQRVQALLSKLSVEPTEADLGIMRAVQVLERHRGDKALAVLREWSAGTRGMVLTDEAVGALGRIEKVDR